MSGTGSEFARLMDRLRSGDAEAAQEIFRRYGPAIQFVVRQRLNRRMRSEFDSLDFVQEAWGSFFHIPPERCTFRTPQELVTFLSCIARNKVIDAYRQRYRTAKRDLRRVSALQGGRHDPPGRQPTPSKWAIAHEEWERLLQGKPPKIRHALEMLRAGHSRQEIAASLSIHPKRIQRLLRHMKEARKGSP
jgi:RNA polymerase sigma-70 factor (ECF subfamily)